MSNETAVSVSAPVSKNIHNRVVRDEEMVARLQRGDEWVFHLLIRRFREEIFSIAFGVTLDAQISREIVQEVLLLVYHTIGSYKADIPLVTWLHRITIHRCLHRKRRWGKRHRWRQTSQTQEDSRELDQASEKTGVPGHGRVHGRNDTSAGDALKLLPEQARVIFTLREIAQLSYTAIAAVLGSRAAAIRTRMFHVRKRLRKVLLASEGSQKGSPSQTSESQSCSDILIDKYLNGDVASDELPRLQDHFIHCTPCGTQVSIIENFIVRMQDQLATEKQGVDFVALEKQVITAAKQEHRASRPAAWLFSSLLCIVPALVVASLLFLFFAYLKYG